MLSFETEFITSLIASASIKLILLFKNARLENSPLTAYLQPFLIKASIISLAIKIDPWQIISTLSSPVNE